jgi:hypothetical protein
MLDNLSNNQVELALSWLASPIQEPPPQELEHLNQMEWFLLQRMLDSLQLEQKHNPVQ